MKQDLISKPPQSNQNDTRDTFFLVSNGVVRFVLGERVSEYVGTQLVKPSPSEGVENSPGQRCSLNDPLEKKGSYFLVEAEPFSNRSNYSMNFVRTLSERLRSAYPSDPKGRGWRSNAASSATDSHGRRIDIEDTVLPEPTYGIQELNRVYLVVIRLTGLDCFLTNGLSLLNQTEHVLTEPMTLIKHKLLTCLFRKGP